MVVEPVLDLHEVRTVQDLAALLRHLRRRQARQRGDRELTYREIAARTGWSVGLVSGYFTGAILPPTDRFDVLVALLGASRMEQGAYATVRDRVEELRRTAAPPGAARPSVVPRQLPADVTGFVGRAGQLAELDGLCRARRPVAVVAGTAGVGKSALALHWAHRVVPEFADGQLYVNLRGFDPSGAPMTPAEAIRGFLDAFALAPHQVPASLHAQVGLYRSLLAGRRVLVVLDNARDVDQVRPLLPGSAGCLAVVTSRGQLTGLVAADGAHPVILDLLTAAEARELLLRRLGRTRVEAEPLAVDEIVDQCARLPLALAIVAARAATHQRFPLAAFAGELRAAGNALDALESTDAATDVRGVFSWSYNGLGAAAARLFRLLGVHCGPDITVPAAASLAGLPASQIRPLLAELAQANLVTEHAVGRFAMHDLLRAYAAEQAAAHLTEAERREAVHRGLDHYLHSGYAAALLLSPYRLAIVLPQPLPGVVPAPVADHAQAMAWFADERPVVLAALDQAAGTGFDSYTWQLAWTLWPYLDRHGLWHDWTRTQETALDAARRLDDLTAQAMARHGLARGHARLGAYSDAYSHLCEALELYRRLDDRAGLATAHHNLAHVLLGLDRHEEAIEHARHALDDYRATGDLMGQANALNAIGWCASRLGDHRQALAQCEQALALFQRLGDRHGEAATLDSIGVANHHLARHAEAVSCYQRSLTLIRGLGHRYSEAETLIHLGDTHEATGDTRATRSALEAALAILEELDHGDAAVIRERLVTGVPPTAPDPAPGPQ
jgi:tetratricopeptide (TPR) repeat protein